MDSLSPAQRSQRMALVRSGHTKPELLVRRLVHALGYRYRLHVDLLPGRPDLTFTRRRAVIFVHGCFWHRHPDPACRLARMPKSRPEFWRPKLERNRERDLEIEQRLSESGWRVLVLWECELRDREGVAERIKVFLG